MIDFAKVDAGLIVLIWPDGTWALEENYAKYAHMSDDYQRVDVYSYDDWILLDPEIRTKLVTKLMGD